MEESTHPEHEPSGGGEEKRRDLRIPLRVLKVEATEKNKREIFFGYASNISVSGLFIQTPSPKEVGTQVRLKFSLPSSKKEINCLAEVVWVKNYSGKGSSPGMGLKFVEIAQDVLGSVEAFVASGAI